MEFAFGSRASHLTLGIMKVRAIIDGFYRRVLHYLERILQRIFPHAQIRVRPANTFILPADLRKVPFPHYRMLLAEMFLPVKGEGIEIGALHCPLPVPAGLRVRYVDRMSREDLRKHYPEFKNAAMVEADYICDGETLEAVPDCSQDFVIANSILEHFENPLRAMSNMFRVLKPGGVIFMGVPDKRYIFDVKRPVTPFSHLLDDYRAEKPPRDAHFEEWVRFLCNPKSEAEVETKKKQLLDIGYSIHFHCWTQFEMLDILLGLKRELNLDFHIKALISICDYETVWVLEKRAAGA